MNVKIKNQDLCFKITEGELQKLRDGKALNTTVSFPGKEFIVMIEAQEKNKKIAADIILGRDEACLNLVVSLDALKILADMGRSRDGIQQEVDGTSVSLQVDIRKRAGESRNK